MKQDACQEKIFNRGDRGYRGDREKFFPLSTLNLFLVRSREMWRITKAPKTHRKIGI